ncbi:MAG: hypothetical protein K1X55_16785 [Chitinophagales bacterium]|nr:hypothetical protein [Chitinophagales bacterium]
MLPQAKRTIAICLFLGIIIACQQNKPKVLLSFYHWKTTYQPSETEQNMLSKLAVQTIYVRYFDVDWNEERQQAEPLAKINFLDTLSNSISMIPVVFITNEVFIKIKEEDISQLAKNIHSLVQKINSPQNRQPKEIQFDCDWTLTTKEKFFSFLQAYTLLDKEIALSATIRLHQVKFVKKTGIPPVDRGMLMFYNMGDFSSPAHDNSIYNKNDASKYIQYCKNYPLPLDVALPIFSWAIQYRNNRVLAIFNEIDIQKVINTPQFKLVKEDLFQANNSFLWEGKYFQKGDLLRYEAISPQQCMLAAKNISRNLKKQPRNIVFFDLDSLNLVNYSNEAFLSISRQFN